MPGKPKERPGIQSVEIAARILAGMTNAHAPLPLKDIARLAGMHPGKVHRYLVSLTRSGLAVQEPASGHYSIGPQAIAFGLAGLRSVSAVRCAAEYLPRLRDETSETAILSLWTSAGPIVVQIEESSRPVFMNIRVGSLLPILASATGRVFAAHLPRELTAPLIAAEAKRGRSRSCDREVERMLAAVLADGVAKIEGLVIPSVAAIAAPVLDHRGRIAVAIGILGQVQDLRGEGGASAAATLARIAAEMSARMGFTAQGRD
jgi:DNA-binding IclR family transcriptional regulator